VLRVVIDTNVFVSAQLSRHGAPAQVLKAWRERAFVLVSSPATIAEVAETMSGFVGLQPYHVSKADVDDLLTLLKTETLLVSGSAVPVETHLDDQDDLMFLACALEGEAEILVSGDRHLRSLGQYQGIEILNAREFLDRLAEDAEG
jgi:hypothetical protein